MSGHCPACGKTSNARDGRTLDQVWNKAFIFMRSQANHNIFYQSGTHIDNVRAPGTTSKPPVHTRQDTMNPATPAHHGLSPSGPFPKTCARPWHLKPRSSRGRHRRCAPSSGLAARLRAKPHREPCGEGAGANDSHSHTDNSESVLPGGRARWRSRRRTRWRRRRPAAAATRCASVDLNVQDEPAEVVAKREIVVSHEGVHQVLHLVVLPRGHPVDLQVPLRASTSVHPVSDSLALPAPTATIRELTRVKILPAQGTLLRHDAATPPRRYAATPHCQPKPLRRNCASMPKLLYFT